MKRAFIGNPTLRTNMGIERIAVLGAGQMGNGIAQVAACAGYQVVMIDIKQDYLDNGLAAIENSLSRVVKKEKNDSRTSRSSNFSNFYFNRENISSRC